MLDKTRAKPAAGMRTLVIASNAMKQRFFRLWIASLSLAMTEDGAAAVIARSEATKQSGFLVTLDCFAVARSDDGEADA